MILYQGYEVLEEEPNRIDGEEVGVERSLALLDNLTGAVASETYAATPLAERPFTWFLEGRAAIADFRGFLDRRLGRLVPCWVPTWQADLAPTAAFSAAGVTVRDAGYTRTLFPHPARRHVALITPAGGVIPRGVVAAAENGDGTETLTLASPPGVLFPASGGLVSLLALCRLASDDVGLTWASVELAEATLRFAEIPREAPTP